METRRIFIVLNRMRHIPFLFLVAVVVVAVYSLRDSHISSFTLFDFKLVWTKILYLILANGPFICVCVCVMCLHDLQCACFSRALSSLWTFRTVVIEPSVTLRVFMVGRT